METVSSLQVQVISADRASNVSRLFPTQTVSVILHVDNMKHMAGVVLRELKWGLTRFKKIWLIFYLHWVLCVDWIKSHRSVKSIFLSDAIFFWVFFSFSYLQTTSAAHLVTASSCDGGEIHLPLSNQSVAMTTVEHSSNKDTKNGGESERKCQTAQHERHYKPSVTFVHFLS